MTSSSCIVGQHQLDLEGWASMVGIPPLPTSTSLFKSLLLDS